MEYYRLDTDEVLKRLNTSKSGLNEVEADKRLKTYGKNTILNKKKKSNIKKFLNEFNDLMIIILIITSIISFILSILNNEPFTDSIIIITIVILNSILGFIQELKADKKIDSLKKMQKETTKVRRDNKVLVINTEDIVKGDILILESGDTVCADARIIKQISLKTDESSLTGESIPVSKDTSKLEEDVFLSSRTNMIYSSTKVVYGKCEAVVTETGMNTEFGKIAKHLIIGIIKNISIKETLMLAISLAVAAIPEGLPAVITITLSLGMNDLAKKKAIVRRMSSVETLGSTEVICSDKTGTITKNQMVVKEIYFDNKLIDCTDIKDSNILIEAMALNNDVEKNEEEYIGESTEIALYKLAEKVIDINHLKNNNQRVNEIPFDSTRKMMSTVNLIDDKYYLYSKGSFDSIIEKSRYIYKNNKVVELTDELKDNLRQIEKEEASKAYRVLAYAYKELDNYENIDEDNLIFIGLSSMIDPPRESVKSSIEACKSANIKPIMITGDSLTTAKAIAKEVGILDNDEKAITGFEIDNLSDEELIDCINNYSVYARVSPTNKYSIVNAFKKKGMTVAMTGDGVNDAPALKSADIGVGMGITGTEVSKDVSDIILVDDSFSTIVDAVKEGRRIFDNIRNVLVYLLTGNITEILVVFIGMLFGIEIFLPVQLLYINLITDSIPAIALAFEKEEINIMNRKIRKKDSSFFTPFVLAKIITSSLLKTLAIISIYFINLRLYNSTVATTASFLTIILLEIVFSYSCKNLKKKVMNNNLFNNPQLNKSIIFLIGLQLIIFNTKIGSIFKIVSLTIPQVLYIIFIVLIVFFVDELSKNILTKLFND